MRLLWMIALTTTVVSADPIVNIYPSGSSVPENLLRIELRLSEPLHPPLSINNLRLIDANGVEIKDPFLDLVLPSNDDKRMTILFHPGRVKTGVGANLALGRALHAGADVTLVINHTELVKPIYKTWQVTVFDNKSPQPGQWTFEKPRRGSRSSLMLYLHKPISSTAENRVAIRGPAGERLAGSGRLEHGETVWRFTPSQPWQPGSYAIVTHPDLEDVAGNRPCCPFQVSASNAKLNDQSAERRFEISN